MFFEDENYHYFLRLYKKYINPVADTFAWCLMKNHFHFLVYLKEPEEINKKGFLLSSGKEPKIPNASRQFSHFFNSYTQAINKKYNRTGSLFEKPFERKRVNSEDYFKRAVYYIHNNPVHHGITAAMSKYPWSSYNGIISSRETLLQRDEVIKWFGSLENFKAYHNMNHRSDF